MGSLTFDGVWFSIYSFDHPPPHAHGKYAGIEVIVEFVDGVAIIARRSRPINPPNAKRSDVKKVLQTASKHAELLMKLWEETHG